MAGCEAGVLSTSMAAVPSSRSGSAPSSARSPPAVAVALVSTVPAVGGRDASREQGAPGALPSASCPPSWVPSCDPAMLPSSSSPTRYSSRGACGDTTPSNHLTRTVPASSATTWPTLGAQGGPLSAPPAAPPSPRELGGAASSQSRQRMTASPRR